jgi:hypothetical protein
MNKLDVIILGASAAGLYCAGVAGQRGLTVALLEKAKAPGKKILTDGLGLAHVMQSYFGEAYISFTACRDIMPDPNVYSQCLQNSFDELLAAAEALSAPEAKAPPAGKPPRNAKTKPKTTKRQRAKAARTQQENA